jgi:hypothetical protein
MNTKGKITKPKTKPAASPFAMSILKMAQQEGHASRMLADSKTTGPIQCLQQGHRFM